MYTRELSPEGIIFTISVRSSSSTIEESTVLTATTSLADTNLRNLLCLFILFTSFSGSSIAAKQKKRVLTLKKSPECMLLIDIDFVYTTQTRNLCVPTCYSGGRRYNSNFIHKIIGNV